MKKLAIVSLLGLMSTISFADIQCAKTITCDMKECKLNDESIINIIRHETTIKPFGQYIFRGAAINPLTPPEYSIQCWYANSDTPSDPKEMILTTTNIKLKPIEKDSSWKEDKSLPGAWICDDLSPSFCKFSAETVK